MNLLVCTDVGEVVTHQVTSVSQQAGSLFRDGAGVVGWMGSWGTKQESTRPRFSGIKQQGGLHGSAVTGQHPPLYRGKGVPVPARFCNLREHKHGQTEVSRQRAKAEAVRMLSGAYEGQATVCCLWNQIPLWCNRDYYRVIYLCMYKYRKLFTYALYFDKPISLTIYD